MFIKLSRICEVMAVCCVLLGGAGQCLAVTYGELASAASGISNSARSLEMNVSHSLDEVCGSGGVASALSSIHSSAASLSRAAQAAEESGIDLQSYSNSLNSDVRQLYAAMRYLSETIDEQDDEALTRTFNNLDTSICELTRRISMLSLPTGGGATQDPLDSVYWQLPGTPQQAAAPPLQQRANAAGNNLQQVGGKIIGPKI